MFRTCSTLQPPSCLDLAIMHAVDQKYVQRVVTKELGPYAVAGVRLPDARNSEKRTGCWGEVSCLKACMSNTHGMWRVHFHACHLLPPGFSC